MYDTQNSITLHGVQQAIVSVDKQNGVVEASLVKFKVVLPAVRDGQVASAGIVRRVLDGKESAVTRDWQHPYNSQVRNTTRNGKCEKAFVSFSVNPSRRYQFFSSV